MTKGEMTHIKEALGEQGELVFYTDGSFKRVDGDISDILMYGSGGTKVATAAVVIMRAGDKWRDEPVVTVRVLEGGKYVDNAYPMEMTGVVLAHMIAKDIGWPYTINTDCEGLFKTLTSSKEARDFTRRDNCVLLQAGKQGKENLRWVRAHPERTGKSEQAWSKDEWGIFLADRAAAGKYDQWPSDILAMKFSVKMEEVLANQVKERQWIWVDDKDCPITDTVSKRVKKARMEEYLVVRDRLRAVRDKEPKWKGTCALFAAHQFEMRGMDVGERARAARLVWDKGFHGGNINKYGILGSAECVMCGEEDGARHWMVECQHPDCVVLREDARQQLETNLSEINNEDGKERALMECMWDMAMEHKDADRIWTGLWGQSLGQEIEGKVQIGTVCWDEVMRLQGAAMTVGRILAKTATALWELKERSRKGSEVSDKRLQEMRQSIREIKLLRRVSIRKEKRSKARVKKDSEDIEEEERAAMAEAGSSDMCTQVNKVKSRPRSRVHPAMREEDDYENEGQKAGVSVGKGMGQTVMGSFYQTIGKHSAASSDRDGIG